MNMTPRNIAILVGAGLIGLFIGIKFPVFSVFLLLPIFGYVAFILLRNNGAAVADPATTAAARRFESSADKAAIYVMRKGFVGGQQGMNVTIDGTLNSQFRTGHFVRAEVAPGEHTVTAQLSSQTKGTAMTHTVTLAPGECVLIDVKLNMGALQGSLEAFETRDPAEARGKIATLKLVEWKE